MQIVFLGSSFSRAFRPELYGADLDIGVMQEFANAQPFGLVVLDDQ